MKRFILGVSCGFAIACSSVAFASNSIQALLFPVGFEINGDNMALDEDYKVLNVDGHYHAGRNFMGSWGERPLYFEPQYFER